LSDDWPLHGGEIGMKLTRRIALHLATGAWALPFVSRTVLAFPAGGTVDILARIIGQSLSDRLGQPVIIDNRPGAASNLATQTVVRAAADGYTLLAVTSPNVINQSLYDKLDFDFLRDITPVASVASLPDVMVVSPSLPVKTVSEFIEYAKANPGKINMGSAGSGTSGHVAGELFRMITGIEMVHVPYRGGPQVLTALLGGQVHVMFDVLPNSVEQIRTGQVNALGVTTAARSMIFPNIPAIGEFVPDYDVTFWCGFGVPKGTPTEIVNLLSREINAALTDSDNKKRIVDLGSSILTLSPSDFGKFMADDAAKWAKVVKFSGAKPD
jgi:tripartite-type tricarboxylate transporter receptor subunit TctC